jgi:hypothetical protein
MEIRISASTLLQAGDLIPIFAAAQKLLAV